MPEEIVTTAASTANNTPFFQSAGGAGLINGASSLLGTWAQYKANKALAKEQREWNEEMMDKQNEWSLNMWNKTNEYNSPSAQVQRLIDAGLNPLYYGLDGSSANAFQSAQPLGYERAQAPNFGNAVGEGINTYAQMKSLNKDLELKNAQIDKLEADTAGVGLDNQFKDLTMEARVQSESLKNDIDRATAEKIKAETENVRQEFKKLIAETDNEIAKKALVEAQTNYANMQTNEIAALLPYKTLLIQAQTEAEKAQAAASFAKAAIDNGLLKGGYVENMLEQQAYEITKTLNESKKAEFEAMLAEFKANVRTGNAIDLSRYEEGSIGESMAKFLNAFYQDTSLLGEALGPLTGVVVAAVAKGVGKGAGKK